MKQYASTASVTEEARDLAIPSALGLVESTLSTFEENIDMLLKRLHPILLSDQPSNEKQDGKCRPLHSVPLAEQLTRIQERIEILNTQTLGVYHRIEL